MLVLSRYKDQSIYIGDDIIVTIVDVRGDRIRLGVEAPANVSVHRQEIYEQIKREREQPAAARQDAPHAAREEKDGASEELRSVRSQFAGSTAIVIGGWVNDAAAQRLEKSLNIRLEWCSVNGYSEDQMNEDLARRDVSLFIVQEPWAGKSGLLERAVMEAGKQFVVYPHSVFTADRVAKAICERRALPADRGSMYNEAKSGGPLAGRRARAPRSVEMEPAYEELDVRSVTLQ